MIIFIITRYFVLEQKIKKLVFDKYRYSRIVNYQNFYKPISYPITFKKFTQILRNSWFNSPPNPSFLSEKMRILWDYMLQRSLSLREKHFQDIHFTIFGRLSANELYNKHINILKNSSLHNAFLNMVYTKIKKIAYIRIEGHRGWVVKRHITTRFRV